MTKYIISQAYLFWDAYTYELVYNYFLFVYIKIKNFAQKLVKTIFILLYIIR
jgi:hypothetical protein